VKRPVLVGHSLGASIALKYALRWPDDVEALVLMGADARLSRLEPRMRQTIELVRRLGIAGWVESHWSKNPPFSEESIERSPEMLERYRAMVIANSAENYVRTCLAIASCEDLSGALGEIAQPALVVVGGKDDRTLPEDGRRIAARMPRVTLFEVPTAGHSLPLEAPDEIAAAISRFLDGVGMGGETA
jgi:pimeloyl-ACP methyl ester carboxylesterase